MKGVRFPEEQIIAVLPEHEAGAWRRLVYLVDTPLFVLGDTRFRRITPVRDATEGYVIGS